MLAVLLTFSQTTIASKGNAPVEYDPMVPIVLVCLGTLLSCLYWGLGWYLERRYRKAHDRCKIMFMETVLDLKLVENSEGGYDATYKDYETGGIKKISLPKNYHKKLVEIAIIEEKGCHEWLKKFYSDVPEIVKWFER